MSKLTILCGPPGSGKSTFAKNCIENDGDLGAMTIYINQDSQGRSGHEELFRNAIRAGKDIIVDRMSFNKQQRSDYLSDAKAKGYETEIIVLHQPYTVCLDRAIKRIGSHETIKDEKNARSALQLFFAKYERPTEDEADKITFVYPEGEKPKVLIVDLDGTLCNVDHRLHHVQKPAGEKKDWKSFFEGIPNDSINEWCREIINAFQQRDIGTVFCSGRDDNHRKNTQEWLAYHGFGHLPLYMRNRNDYREDFIIKEIILDYELLTRYEPYFMIDDRTQVVEMYRKRGYTVLQCARGDF